MSKKSPALARLHAAERASTSARSLLAIALRDVGRAERELRAAWREYKRELHGQPVKNKLVLGSDADKWLDLVGESDQVRQADDE